MLIRAFFAAAGCGLLGFNGAFNSYALYRAFNIYRSVKTGVGKHFLHRATFKTSLLSWAALSAYVLCSVTIYNV